MTSPTTDRRYGVNTSMAVKVPVRVATITNLTTLNGLLTVDGVTVASGDRVLVKSQTTQTQNGIYVADSGDWSRALDFDGNRDVTKGTMVLVTDGSSLAGSWWTVSSSNPITIDTSNITFSQTGEPTTASATTYTPAGTGAVVSTVETELRALAVIPSQYGGDPTGVASSTAAFDYALATGKNVYIPAGHTYRCGVIAMTTANQTVFGDGPLSVIQQESTGANLLYPKAANITIRDLKLKGIETGTTNTIFGVFTATATPANYLTVENVVFTGSSGSTGFNNAVKLDDSCNYGRVINCTIDSLWGNTSGRGYGVLIGNAVGGRVLHNTMIGASGRGRHGVYFSAGCSDSVAAFNDIRSFDYEGITQYATGVQPACARNIIANNTVYACAAAGASTSGAIGVYQHTFGAIISNNTITASGKIGIAVDGTGVTDTANTLVMGNTVSYSGTTGIQLISPIRCTVIGNIIHESSTASAGTSANINVRSDGTTACTDVLIAGNISTGSTYARSAITVDSTAPVPVRLRLRGNTFGAGVSYTMELNSVTGIEIDGRLQFRFDSVSYGPIANAAAYTGSLVLTGADQGDIATVSHTSNSDSCAFYVYVSSANTGTLNILNLSGGNKTIASGTLRVDVWRRNSPL